MYHLSLRYLIQLLIIYFYSLQVTAWFRISACRKISVNKDYSRTNQAFVWIVILNVNIVKISSLATNVILVSIWKARK